MMRFVPYIILLVIYFTIVPLLFSLCIRLAVRLLGHSKVPWKNRILFGFLLALIALATRATLLATGQPLPLSITLILALTLQIALGSWFFRARATDVAGQALGWDGAAELSAVTSAFWAATVFVLMGLSQILHAFAPPIQP